MKAFSFSIFHKLLVTMLLVALVPLCTIWYVDYRDATTRISNAVEQQLRDTADRLSAQVDNWVEMNLRALRQNADTPLIRSMDRATQEPVLRAMLKEYSWTYLVFTIGPDGMNVGRSDDKPLIDYSDRIYVKQVLEGRPYGEQVVISRTNNRPAVILSVPITDEAVSNRIIGVMAAGSTLADLSDIVTKARIGETGYAFLLEPSGKVVAHQKEEYVSKMADFSRHPAFLARPEKGTKQISYNDNGREVVATVQTTRHGWILVAQQDQAEAFAPIREANRNALILLVATLVVVTLIAYFFSQRLTTPIRRLTRIADEMSRGRVVPRIAEAERRDEIGSLARAIDRMGTSIRLAMDRLSAKKSA
ncbi:MAG TPA: cache and HAMP domain-containing protein [Burkholderiales bacterium]